MGKSIFRLIAAALDACPPRARSPITAALAALWYATASAKRRNVRENLAAAGIEPRGSIVFGIFRRHVENIIDIFVSSRWSLERIRAAWTVEGDEFLARGVSGSGGAILVTAHLGCWELGALLLRGLGFRMHVVAGVQMNRLLTGAVREAKEKRGIEVVSPENSFRRIYRALGSGGVVALLVDGDVYTGGVEVPLFGRPTKLPRGPLHLARAAGAPVVTCFTRRLGGGRYRIFLEEALGAGEASRLSDEEALARIYSPIERYIAENADQWCLFRGLWEREA